MAKSPPSASQLAKMPDPPRIFPEGQVGRGQDLLEKVVDQGIFNSSEFRTDLLEGDQGALSGVCSSPSLVSIPLRA
jgi:hypothetical protein